ncbi:UDP-N-acetylmuramate dehydrogenase [Anaerocaecibacter muris]|uniref:UDP-N-acetylmuramate dehydrogenase n=1 Tax=Anaerocaecibacter muris TaxID=2941513 RepID=UPI00203F0AAD|nr:UDP-N-acetylmuramate dehydrogenase [Anaerocaecibacter muris]
MRDSLSAYTTFGIGGRARRISVARSRSELIDLAPDALVLGRGSNVLVSDDGYDGDAVINRYDDIVFNGDLVVAGSGACLASVSSAAARCGLSGLEWAIGIPGSVGGAVRMNAGAFGGAISDRLLYADVLRGGAVVRLGRGELGFSYRHSAIADDDVVIAAAFLLDKISAAVTLARCGEYTERRRSKQPSGKSAGSVFKNPSGISVGKVLDGAGLKGLRNGGAVISPVHANIIVNTGDATADDVCGLIRIMKGELEARGIEAKEEIIYVGGFKNGVLGRLPHAYDIQQKGR